VSYETAHYAVFSILGSILVQYAFSYVLPFVYIHKRFRQNDGLSVYRMCSDSLPALITAGELVEDVRVRVHVFFASPLV
jgi:hypothetical protein